MRRDHLVPGLACAALVAVFTMPLPQSEAAAALDVASPAAAPTDPASHRPHPAVLEEVAWLAQVEDVAVEHLRRRQVDDAADLARTIVDESLAAGLDPMLIVAMVDVESDFQDDARSHKGALGLMQVMPRTGRDLARRHGFDWKGERTLLDPHTNVRLGIEYMAELVDGFDGDLDHALVAYNRGPTALRRALDAGRRVPTGYADLVWRSYGLLEAQAGTVLAAVEADGAPKAATAAS